DGIGAAVTRVLALAGGQPGDVERFIHGTTIATNAILEQKGAVTAVLTTDGFEDVLELGRMKRSRMYDLAMDPEVPTFLAPRRRRVGIRERLDAKGRVLVPLNETDVRTAALGLRAQGVQAIAVCYLFSFVSPAHERRTREIIAELAPEISVSLSSDVDPTFREYERLCVTAFDAYLGPVVKRYLAGLADTLRGLGVPAVPLIMRSRGGIVSAALAARQPVTLFLSGPAGGVIGAGFAAERSGVRDFVSLDMGGTSNDVALAREGKPLLASEGSIGPYPVRTPMVDVNTIGAGGGSIAWIDAGGGLRVGRRGAGARRGARRGDGDGGGARARGARRPGRLRSARRRHRAPPRADAAGAHGRRRSLRRQPLPRRARRRRTRADARGRRAGARGAGGLHGRHALRRAGLRAGGADRGARHAGARARDRRGVSRRARARVRLRAHAAAGGVREFPRGAHVPAAAAGADAGGAIEREPGGGAPGRAPRVLRALRADGELRARAAAAGRAPGRTGHRRAERHDHRAPARRDRARGRRREPAPPEGLMAIDPILLEVLRNRLDAIADEMELTLLKSAASPIVKEGLDASAA